MGTNRAQEKKYFMADAAVTEPSPPEKGLEAPYPGSKKMPRWDTGELIDAPRFTWRKWFTMLGPGLIAGGAAIGGGEWLLGPEVTARYGGSLLWLASLSILGQLIYNIEISRYTLYSGEPIFTGKLRILPGPGFWLVVYLVLDFGSVFPYLAASAATPLFMTLWGRLPDPAQFPGDATWMTALAWGVFFLALVPLIFGGKIYNTLKAIMSFKIVVVLGFLLFLGLFYSHRSTWTDIFSGFFKFGNVPIRRGEDFNGNGMLDPGEDWDGDGHLDVVEPRFDSNHDGEITRQDAFIDRDGDGICDGDNVDNVFVSLVQGRGLPPIDWSVIALLAAMAAIAGQGGLTNTPISNYTRDSGWGMGWHVGAIPSLVGGHSIKLSHAGCVFHVTRESLVRWKRWYRHVARDQLVVWFPACFLGLALPSMLSVEFLRRGTEVNDWAVAGMTATGVESRVAAISGTGLGRFCWFMTLFCGFLVLAPSMASTADGLIRRWVDVFWTASSRLRKLDPKEIKKVYFTVLFAWSAFALVMLTVGKPKQLLIFATIFYNFALGFSCFHSLFVNRLLLPRALRPRWFACTAMLAAGMFFTVLGLVSTLEKLGYL